MGFERGGHGVGNVHGERAQVKGELGRWEDDAIAPYLKRYRIREDHVRIGQRRLASELDDAISRICGGKGLGIGLMRTHLHISWWKRRTVKP